MVGTRTGGRASVEIMGAVGTRETEVNVDFQIEIVPADGISGFWKSGEFGTSPLLGSTWDKPVLARSLLRGQPSSGDIVHVRAAMEARISAFGIRIQAKLWQCGYGRCPAS